MLHYAIIVTQVQRCSAIDRRAIKHYAGRYGLSHTSWKETQKAARVLSKVLGVERVTVIRVRESAEGVWRNGRKS